MTVHFGEADDNNRDDQKEGRRISGLVVFDVRVRRVQLQNHVALAFFGRLDGGVQEVVGYAVAVAHVDVLDSVRISDEPRQTGVSQLGAVAAVQVAQVGHGVENVVGDVLQVLDDQRLELRQGNYARQAGVRHRGAVWKQSNFSLLHYSRFLVFYFLDRSQGWFRKLTAQIDPFEQPAVGSDALQSSVVDRRVRGQVQRFQIRQLRHVQERARVKRTQGQSQRFQAVLAKPDVRHRVFVGVVEVFQHEDLQVFEFLHHLDEKWYSETFRASRLSSE